MTTIISLCRFIFVKAVSVAMSKAFILPHTARQKQLTVFLYNSTGPNLDNQWQFFLCCGQIARWFIFRFVLPKAGAVFPWSVVFFHGQWWVGC